MGDGLEVADYLVVTLGVVFGTVEVLQDRGIQVNGNQDTAILRTGDLEMISHWVVTLEKKLHGHCSGLPRYRAL